MKNILHLSFLVLMFNSVTFAQPMQKPTSSCENGSIQLQADSIKVVFEKNGFLLMKEAALNMESDYELPVIVPLKSGSLYHVAFIGDMSTRVYEVRMYDWEENKVFYGKKMWGDVDGNIISYDYVPRSTQYHMIKPLQVNKKRNKVCGYLMLFKKVR